MAQRVQALGEPLMAQGEETAQGAQLVRWLPRAQRRQIADGAQVGRHLQARLCGGCTWSWSSLRQSPYQRTVPAAATMLAL